MAAAHLASVVRFLHRLSPPGDLGGSQDSALLARFCADRDEAAFTALVQRHGPMVLGVCRRVLGDAPDAEDAFQATFLVLARKPRSVRRLASLGSWLYGVACRTALKARGQTARRRAKERQAVPSRAEAPDPTTEVAWRDLRPVLDEEVRRLPEKYRAPFVLCYLEERTNAEAAVILGCPKGTVLSRLATARERLRVRLSRRGVTLSAGALAAALSQSAEAAVAPALVSATTSAAVLFAEGNLPAAAVSAEAVVLTKGMLRAMLMSKLRLLGSVLLLATILVSGAALVFAAAPTEEKTLPQAEEAPPPQPKRAVPAVTITEVMNAYEDNDALVDERFTGKRVRVTGLVVRIQREPGPKPGDTYWLLMGDESGQTAMRLQGARDGVRLVGEPRLGFRFVGPEDRKRLARLKSSQVVTVEGRCDGKATPVGKQQIITFVDCRVIETSDARPREAAPDPKAVK
jgi:RNA polymerase sigma factor (sigma-70 family)